MNAEGDVVSATERMKAKIDSREGKRIYSMRMGIVEPVFGHITGAKRMDRFLLRGLSKVKIQWLLYGVVHNIEKTARYGDRYAPVNKGGG